MQLSTAGVHFLQFRIKRHLVYAGLIGVLVFSYLGLVLLLTQQFAYNPSVYPFITGLAVCLAALGFYPLERQVQKLTDFLFFKNRSGYHHTIVKMLKEMCSCNRLEDLTQLIINTIYNEMRVETIAFYLKSADQKFYDVVKHRGWENLAEISVDDPLVAFIRQEKRVIAKELLLSDFRLRLLNSKARLRERELFYRMTSVQAEVIVPFVEDNDVIGFMLLGNKRSEEPYAHEDINLLELVGNQAVLGLQSARLYEISQNKVKELTTLFEVGRMMGATLDISEIYTSIIRSVIQVINVDRGILFLYDNAREELHSVAGYGASDQDIQGITLKVGETIMGRIFKVGNPVLVPHATRQTEYIRRLGVDSYIAVPMKAKDKIIGLLTIDNAPSQRPLDNINMELLVTLVGQMAIAIENAKLYDDAKEKVRELSDLNENILRLKSYNEDILQTMPSGVVSFDNTHAVVTFNQMAELIMGLRAETVIGKSIEELWGTMPELVAAMSQETANTEVLFKDGKGKLKPLNINTKQLRDTSGNISGLLTVITDMSELKLLEQQVRRSDRVSALGTMVAGVAHEIKNPLTSMKLFVQLMEENKKNPNFWEEYGSIIANEVDRLENIVEDFLGFARTPEVHIKPVKIKEIFDKVFKLVKTQSRKENVTVNFVQDKDSTMVRADTQKIMQVLLNLILNAIQAMPQNPQHKGEVRIESREEPEQVVILVKDNGSGISKEHLEKMFTPFFTTKQKGTGLGLSIAHKIIQEHGGSINVDSELGKGTTFKLTLPLA